MAIISNIVIDNSVKTAILTVTSSGNSVETLTYDFSTNQINFSSRQDINISISEFLDFIAQVNIFQTAIIFNFNPNVITTIPFGSCNNTENHDSVLNKWSLVSIYGASPRVCNYSYDKQTLTMTFANRALLKMLSFPEWMYFLPALNHYTKSVQLF